MTLFAPGKARAEEGTVPVLVTAPEPFTLRGTGEYASFRTSCTTPCTVNLFPGEYKYTSSKRSGELVAFTGPSRLDLHGPAEPLHTVGLVMAGIGVLGVVIPIIAIFSTCTDPVADGTGRTTTRSCVTLGESTDRTLAIMAGGGFALGVIGGILYLATSGGLTVTDVNAASRSGQRSAPKLRPLARFGESLSRGALFTF